MLKRTLQTTLLLALACAPAAAASPQAHTAAEQAAEASLQETEQLLDGRGVRTGRELTDSLRELATRVRHLRGEDRERAIALLSRPTDADAPADERYTVPELPPLCDLNFCIHSVGSTADAPSAGMAALALAEANAVRNFENGTLGWREAPDDGDGRVDIYLKELGASRLFGFASTDPDQDQQSQHSYLVIDNDFDPAPVRRRGRPRVAPRHPRARVRARAPVRLRRPRRRLALRVERRLDGAADLSGDQGLAALRGGPLRGAGWSSLTELSLTYFEPDPDGDGALDPRVAKPYGDVVWNHFLSSRYGAAGNDLQLATWENSRGLERASTAAYDDRDTRRRRLGHRR